MGLHMECGRKAESGQRHILHPYMGIIPIWFPMCASSLDVDPTKAKESHIWCIWSIAIGCFKMCSWYYVCIDLYVLWAYSKASEMAQPTAECYFIFLVTENVAVCCHHANPSICFLFSHTSNPFFVSGSFTCNVLVEQCPSYCPDDVITTDKWDYIRTIWYANCFQRLWSIISQCHKMKVLIGHSGGGNSFWWDHGPVKKHICSCIPQIVIMPLMGHKVAHV